MQDPRHYDGFISYRRDGARLARYLARALRRHRLPRDVRRRFERAGRTSTRLRVYLDRSPGEPSPERHEREVQPALLAADHLIVVASPSVAKPLRSGEPNRVDRETREFLRLRTGRGLFGVHARGARTHGLPPSLGPHPRLDLIDLAVPAPWHSLWAPAARRARWAVHQCAARLHGLSKEQLQQVEQTVKRGENLRGVLRAVAALAVVAGVLALIIHRADEESRTAGAWAQKAGVAREQGDAAGGAHAVLEALSLRPELGRALAERLAWRPAEAPADWAPGPAGFRVEAVSAAGRLLGTRHASSEAEGAPDGRVQGLPRGPPAVFAELRLEDGVWKPVLPGGVHVTTADPAARGAWIAVVEAGVCSVRPRAGGDALLRFPVPRGQAIERVALHVPSKRCWVATRDEDGAAQRLPLGRVHALPIGGKELVLVKAERSVPTSVLLSRDGERALWTLLTGIVRATGTDLEEIDIQSPVEIGVGVPAVAGFLGRTQRIVVVDRGGQVRRETKIGAAELEPVLPKALPQVGARIRAAFHPTGPLAAIAAGDGVRLVVLDGPLGKAPAPIHLSLDARGSITGAAFTHDGSRLVVTDQEGRVFFVGATDEALREAAGRREP